MVNTAVSKVKTWLDDRMHLSAAIEFFSRKTVPRHKHSFWYLFGGLSFFFFGIQLLSGILLLIYYSPTPNTANESLRFIINDVPYGWLLRSIHAWSAHLMIGSVLIHMSSTFFLRSYRKPRELMWVSGVLQLFLLFGFAFTGFLLPWDGTAYFATQIGTEIPRSTPLVGELVVRLLRGGEFVGEDTLKRLFALHVTILPLLTLLLISIHLILNQIHGSSVPNGVKTNHPGIPFFPNYLYREALAWIAGLAILISLAMFFPFALGIKADVLASAPAGIKPSWYFLPLFETLRIVPARIFNLDGEMIVNVLTATLGVGLIVVPFIDRELNTGRTGKILHLTGIALLAYLFASIVLAYFA